MVHKLTITNENSIDALDSSPSCGETAEKNAVQEIGDSVIRSFFHLGDRYLNRYTDDGDSFGNWVGRLGLGAQVGVKYGINIWDRSQSSFRQPKISQRYIPGGSTLTDADARGDYRGRSNVNLSFSMLFSAVLTKAQRKAEPRLQILSHMKLFRRASMNATRSESWIGGRS